MNKIMILLVSSIVILMAGCQEETIELSSLQIIGVENQTVYQNATVNLMDGITVIGNDGIDYSEYMVLSSYSCGFYNDTYLHTEVSKKCDIIYTVVVGDFFVREYATIYIR